MSMVHVDLRKLIDLVHFSDALAKTTKSLAEKAEDKEALLLVEEFEEFRRIHAEDVENVSVEPVDDTAFNN